jgi:hypothetical protein
MGVFALVSLAVLALCLWVVRLEDARKKRRR